jgi:AraC-like DNA-binding protein
MLLPKGAHYAISFPLPPEKSARPVMINFRLTDLRGREIPLGDRVIRLCKDDGTLLPLFSASAQLYKSASPARLKAKVYELIGALFPVAETDECCLAYIGRHYTDRFSIPALAARCAMSETAYRKRFKAITGLSPVQYINRLKVERACQMLLSGDMSPQAISDFLNFYSLPYFYKVFRDCMGCTPNEYRNRK